MGAYYLHYNYIWWLTSETSCSYTASQERSGRRDVAIIEKGPANAAAARLAVDDGAHPAVAATLATRHRVREIAAELGDGITCNAVISKIHRLGISALSPYGGAPGRRFAAKTPAADRPVYADCAAWWFRKGALPAWVVDAKPYVETKGVDARIPRRQRRSLLELSEHTCRWPVGDPRSSRLFFCGAQPLRNKPYCTEHCARAYRHLRDVPQRLRHAARDADRSVVPSSKTAPQRRSTGERR